MVARHTLLLALTRIAPLPFLAELLALSAELAFSSLMLTLMQFSPNPVHS